MKKKKKSKVSKKLKHTAWGGLAPTRVTCTLALPARAAGPTVSGKDGASALTARLKGFPRCLVSRRRAARRQHSSRENPTSRALGSWVPFAGFCSGLGLHRLPFPQTCFPAWIPAPRCPAGRRRDAAGRAPSPRLCRFKAGTSGSRLPSPLHLPAGSRGSQGRRLARPLPGDLHPSASAPSPARGLHGPRSRQRGAAASAHPRQTRAPPGRASAPASRPRLRLGRPARAAGENQVLASREEGEATGSRPGGRRPDGRKGRLVPSLRPRPAPSTRFL